MKVIVGLGNFGDEYANTRHNSGFIILDHAAEEFGLSWQTKPKFKALIAEMRFGTEKVLFVKPTTYYNLSGEAVKNLVDFFKINPSDVLVIHDELALPFGTIRTRLGGSDAGNNGIKNITHHLGQHYARIRIGIANAQRNRQAAEAFVLGRFTPDEQSKLTVLATHAVRFIEDFIHEDQSFIHTSIAVP